MKWKSLSLVRLCDPEDYTVHGILQARILEWGAFPFSRGSSQPRSPALQVNSLPAELHKTPEIPKVLEALGQDRGEDYIYLLLLFSHSVVSDSLQPQGLQHTSLPCPSVCPGVCSNSCPLNRWCHLTISSSVTPLSSCPQSATRFFPMSWLFTSGGQSIGASASASVLPMNIQGWFPFGLTGLISLLSKGLSKVPSSTTVWKHQFFGIQSSLWSNSHICTWLLEKT